ncbi:MAG: hypothetical protein KBF53_04245 [Sphingobium sp.]|nr:hypothetical protein [Sphingobium sp.]
MGNISDSKMRCSYMRWLSTLLLLTLAYPAASSTMAGWEVHGASYSGDQVICDDPKIDPAEKKISCPGEVLPEPTVLENALQIVGGGYLIFSAIFIGAYIAFRLEKHPETVFFEANGMKMCFVWSVVSWLLVGAMFGKAIWQWITIGFPDARLL